PFDLRELFAGLWTRVRNVNSQCPHAESRKMPSSPRRSFRTPHMFRADAESDESCRNATQPWISVQQPYDPWQLCRHAAPLARLEEHVFLHEDLHRLRDAGRQLAAPLDRLQIRG